MIFNIFKGAMMLMHPEKYGVTRDEMQNNMHKLQALSAEVSNRINPQTEEFEGTYEELSELYNNLNEVLSINYIKELLEGMHSEEMMAALKEAIDKLEIKCDDETIKDIQNHSLVIELTVDELRDCENCVNNYISNYVERRTKLDQNLKSAVISQLMEYTAFTIINNRNYLKQINLGL